MASNAPTTERIFAIVAVLELEYQPVTNAHKNKTEKDGAMQNIRRQKSVLL